MIIFGMISALKISTLTLMAVLAVGMTVSFNFAEASNERPDAYAQWGPTSEFTTTGIAVVQVTDHYMNMNPNTVETLTVDVYTERNESNPELTITLTESDVDTGLFLAEVYFSETKTSSENTLQVVNGDIVSVEYTYSQVPGSDRHEDKIGVGQEKTILNHESPVTNPTLSIIAERPNAFPEWDADFYASTDIAVARVVDPFMNAEPNKIETLTASIVVADDYDDGIKITLTETGANTGIFEETIFFTETEESSGNVIKVAEGDDVSLDYLYSEVPGSDNIEDMIEVGDKITIQNSHYVDSIPFGFGATVKLDKEIYSWTDKVYITVRSPFHNLDSDRIDTIGDAPPYTIRMHTSSSDIDAYKLVETGRNTGVFTGEITLSGFTHDADGSGKYGVSTENDTNPITSGLGPIDGFLENSNDDAISVQFDYSEDVTIVGYAEIKWNLGKVQLLEHSYPTTGTAVVRITDPDMNWNPDKIDNFTIDVWSDSDASGINLPVTETDKATGIFEGTVYFSTTDDSSGHRLRVVEGDTITAEYEDNTLPNPYTPEDELDISDTAIIRNTTVPSPYKQMKNGIIAEHVVCNEPFEKIYKSNGYPACVNTLSVEKLIQRGWNLQVLSDEK